MNNLRTHMCVGLDAHNNCDCMPEATTNTHVLFSLSKLSLILFIGLCGPVELLIVHSYVTQLVGLSVDCPTKKFMFFIGEALVPQMF